MKQLKYPVFLLALVATLAGSSCKKTVTCGNVPNVSVGFTINTTLPQYNTIAYVGGSMEVTGGDAGIVIYHYLSDQFQAYDCMCPYDGPGNSKAAVVIQTNKIQVACPVCGSIFNLSDGSVSKGPATCPLKAYKTSYDGTSNVTVSN